MIRQDQLQKGMDVIDINDHMVGTVEHVDDGFIVVQKGFFFPQSHRIPVEAIRSVSEQQINLSITREAAMHFDDGAGFADHPEKGRIVPQKGDVEKSATLGGIDPHKM